MFALEDVWARCYRKNLEKTRKDFRVNEARQWRPDEPTEVDGIDLPRHCVFAQNEIYLELCNPGWEQQKSAIYGILMSWPFCLFGIWMWYGLAVHPLIFSNEIWVFGVVPGRSTVGLWVGWLLGFPCAVGFSFLMFFFFYYTGARSCVFSYTRGRIRFNRLTAKVYVLRPSYCGGDKAFDWSRLRALCDIRGDRTGGIGSLALYHPPFDPQDPAAKGEDCLFVGPDLNSSAALGLWEYIRLYMQEGPTVDYIPPNVPQDYKKIPRFIPHEYSTFCGAPSCAQYKLETLPGIFDTSVHMLGQMTCRWPRFPKEWNSDSGVGEPEERPVQTGATMTAFVYRAQGLLSPADEVELMTHFGTPEGLAAAQARMAG